MVIFVFVVEFFDVWFAVWIDLRTGILMGVWMGVWMGVLKLSTGSAEPKRTLLLTLGT
jgi:hypothetical protein